MLASGPTPQEAATVGAHFAYLQRLTAFGLVLLQAAGETEARAVMEALWSSGFQA